MGLLREFIENNDLFGHQLNLNLNRVGGSHKTIFGGIISIIFKLVVSYYIFNRISTLTTEGAGDKNSTQDMLLD